METLTAAPTIQEVALEQLRPHPDNPRTITADKLRALAASLEAVPAMLRARPLVALPDGRVVAGNQRLTALRELGAQTAPALIVDLDEAEVQAWIVRDNREFGDWEEPALAALLQQLEDEHGVVLAELGFDPDEYEDLLASIGVPEADEEAFEGTHAAGGFEERDGNDARPAMREVVLLYKPEYHARISAWVRGLREIYGTQTSAATIYEAVKAEAARYDIKGADQ